VGQHVGLHRDVLFARLDERGEAHHTKGVQRAPTDRFQLFGTVPPGQRWANQPGAGLLVSNCSEVGAREIRAALVGLCERKLPINGWPTSSMESAVVPVPKGMVRKDIVCGDQR
jgi:hypothetical protein